MVQVAFYKAKYGKWYDKLIAFITKSEFSHCELVFSDGKSFSASNRDGVRFTLIDFNSGHWTLNDVNIGHLDERRMRLWAVNELDSKYDWLGLFFGWGGIQQSSKWFCSELCATALIKYAGLKTDMKPKTISPAILYNLIK